MLLNLAAGLGTAATRQACLAAACVLVGSCSSTPTLPWAPSNLTTGISIYEFQDYQGTRSHVTEDIPDLDAFGGPCVKITGGLEVDTQPVWDDCISSVRVAPGWEAHLYEHPNFGGWDQIVLEDVPDLGEVLGPCHSDRNLDNCVSSIRVFPR